MMSLLSKVFGTSDSRALAALQPQVDAINEREEEMKALSDEGLKAKTTEFKERLNNGESLDNLLPEAFAAVREAARRTLGQRHYDVQLLGGIIIHQGKIAEMRTGEGKTLVATLPVYLNALTGQGVHLVTVNDYLARRDATWMGQIYAALGLSVGIINSQQQSYLYDPNFAPEDSEVDEERDEAGFFKVAYEFLQPVTKKEAYEADITYGTNNEFGFDYLRDNIVYSADQLRQRGHIFAIIDEVDSVLIDEARTPLIISAPSQQSEDLYVTFADIAEKLKVERDYTVDEKDRAIQMTEEGIERAEKLLGVENIYTDAGIKYVHHLETAVRAKALFTREKEYVVREGEVIIVDQYTGRLMPGRRYSEGLHQAIEAKEGVEIKRESQTFATITFQNYFRMYGKLAGMTGTGKTSEEELYKVYGLEVLVVPTNLPTQRIDHEDYIFQTEIGKFKAVAEAVRARHEKGQPILIGTASIEKNELLSEYLHASGIPHQVLNAKKHEEEGGVIAKAGRKGAVTLATNMAGRGVDIKLGGEEATPEEYEEVVKLGGLFVLGTERHNARRIDNQLRGRAGRQGDPGETQFFVSLEDDLMRIFSSDIVKNMMGRFGIPEDQPIENRLISRSLESAQTKIEGFNFDARKHVLSYDDIMNIQRQAIYNRRNEILLADGEIITTRLAEVLAGDEETEKIAAAKRAELGDEEFVEVVRRLMLQTIDLLWVEHLEMMDYLRSSVNLRAYGQRDPLVEYKKEGVRLFGDLERSIDETIAHLVRGVGEGAFQGERRKLREVKEDVDRLIETNEKENAEAALRRSDGSKVGRNDIVTITNGTTTKEMKYKKAQPLLDTGSWRVVTDSK
jgi:preprotein translocase subunit SecA